MPEPHVALSILATSRFLTGDGDSNGSGSGGGGNGRSSALPPLLFSCRDLPLFLTSSSFLWAQSENSPMRSHTLVARCYGETFYGDILHSTVT